MTKEDKAHRKEMVIEYLRDVPVYKWAAKFVKIDQDTLKAWRDEDTEFSDKCELAMSEFVKKTIRKTKPEFQLERMLKDDFSQRLENTGKDGKDLPTPILGILTQNVPSHHSNPEAEPTD